MAAVRIVERSDNYKDTCKNRWKWEWLEKTTKAGEENERIGDCFRKINVDGLARCLICPKDVSYANRGITCLFQHMQSEKHQSSKKAVKNNASLPAAGKGLLKDTTYGMDPNLRPLVVDKDPSKLPPLTPLQDRVSNLEALTLAFMAEHAMPFDAAQDLIDYGKALAADKPAMEELSMDRTTASYKMQHGLAPALQEQLLEELREHPFSLNIDEAMSKTNRKVLAVLVSHFSPSSETVVVNHLDAFELKAVTAESIFEELDKMFIKFNLPWTNLTSVLMDSCSVMRGSQNGLEVLLRKRKAPHLLNIDGDSCHHAHNCAKEFCEPFNWHVEGLMGDIAVDFKWSADLKDRLHDICLILGVKPTTPEMYVSHRWLSVLDVAIDTLRLLDAYKVFYFSWLQPDDQTLYRDVVDEILSRCKVTEKGREKVQDIQKQVKKKWSGFTKAGKLRKARITEKLFDKGVETLLYLELYVKVLPSLKRYVLFFQQKDPVVHLLHCKQHQLFRDFSSYFIKPEALQGALHKIDLSNTDIHLPKSQIFVGSACAELLQSKQGASLKAAFYQKVKDGYLACAKGLQRRMPLSNDTLKVCAALDPDVAGTHTCLTYLLKARSFSLVKDQDSFEQEVRAYNVDKDLRAAQDNMKRSDTDSSTAATPHIVAYWNLVAKTTKYPHLTALAKALVSAFHGPLVESSFSAMGNLLDAKSGNTVVESYAAVQTVRYHMAAQRKTAVQLFAKAKPITDPVPKRISQGMQQAWKGRRERQQQNRTKAAVRRDTLGVTQEQDLSAKTKTLHKGQMLDEAEEERRSHEDRLSHLPSSGSAENLKRTDSSAEPPRKKPSAEKRKITCSSTGPPRKKAAAESKRDTHTDSRVVVQVHVQVHTPPHSSEVVTTEVDPVQSRPNSGLDCTGSTTELDLDCIGSAITSVVEPVQSKPKTKTKQATMTSFFTK